MKLDKIVRYDRNGIKISNGDVIAEGKKGDMIWDGQAIIVFRPLAIVKVKEDHCDIIPFRSGIAKLTEKADDVLKNSVIEIDSCIVKYEFSELSDKKFWGNVEVLSNINLFPL